tara:strand:+ start:158 stop:397 length:240 start_codon:yes stop_codon:yes gene_type:complete
MAFKMSGFSAFTKQTDPQTVNPKPELVPQTKIDKAEQDVKTFTNQYNEAVKSGNKEEIRKNKMDLDYAKQILAEVKSGN